MAGIAFSRGLRRLIAVGLAGLLAPTAASAAPANKPPTISITAVDAESIRAESQLAQFIKNLQLGRRTQASAMLSSRIGPRARAAFEQKQWLPATPTGRADVMMVLYWPDIQIRTESISRDTRRLMVGPRKIAFKPKGKNRPPAGFAAVRMRREAGQWRVDLNVPKALRG